MNEPALTPDQLDRLTQQRRIHIQQRLANHVSTGENLLTTLDHPTLRNTIPELLAALAALTTMTDPNQSDDWQRNPSRSADTPAPNLQPAWAHKKLQQLDRQLDELAGHLNGWLHNPHDPHQPHTCPQCGWKYTRDDIHCRRCGTTHITQLRNVIRRCEHCGQGFVPMKPHARYCTTRCRVAAHRAESVTQVTEAENVDTSR